jgi:acyl carrier protein
VSLEEFFADFQMILHANGCRVENLSMDTRFEELEMNSLELTNALLEVEDHFQVLIPDETWSTWQTLAEVIAFIAEYKQTQAILNLTHQIAEGEVQESVQEAEQQVEKQEEQGEETQ